MEIVFLLAAFATIISSGLIAFEFLQKRKQKK